MPPVTLRIPGSRSDEGQRALRWSLDHFKGRIAVVSSFGAESAVLLALVAELDRSVPVLFLETGQHSPETLDYRQRLAATLGLLDVRDIRPSSRALASRDPDGVLHAFDPDACCALRKVEPLEQALQPFAAWITGRKRTQASTRAAMPVVEAVDGRTKVNPLAHWDAAVIEAEFNRRALPRHPLTARGFASIGCRPLHPVRPARRQPAQRALGGHRQDRVWHSPPIERQ